MTAAAHKTNFVLNIIDADVKANKHGGEVVTRFPPEPSGYLHIGHAKAICLNFSIAQTYKGRCHLRFDDTNPANEKLEFIESIQQDVAWLGFDWQGHLFYASDYFEQLYACACHLIEKGLAYVCNLSSDEVKTFRGSLTEKGQNSPYRDRSVAENLQLFQQMRDGTFEEGACTLRAKIDMASGNINMRDPALYRIKKAVHPHTGESWCIYPMYDFAHAASDAIEGITHSLCTLEFQDHRPLYNWVVEQCDFARKPQQIEFSRLNLNYTVTSKRRLKYLVENKHVDGWDDPRMPTLCGLRRRGVTPASIRKLCEVVGVSKQDSITDFSLFEEIIRDELNQTAPRRFAVLDPLLVEIDELAVQSLTVSNHPQNSDYGRRDVSISAQIYIERDDFMETLSPGYQKLTCGGRIRLLNAYVIECYAFEKDKNGNIIKLKCRYLPETLQGKKPADGIKPKGIIHWVDANRCINAQVRLYDRLFHCENPGALTDMESGLNPDSLHVINNVKLENSFKDIPTTESLRCQFVRVGYFYLDSALTKRMDDHRLVFNRVVSLKDSWRQKSAFVL